MRRGSQTTDRPLLHVMRPGYRRWTWTVTMEVSSNGYCQRIEVTARHPDPAGEMVGSAWAAIELGDDLSKAMETLAVEACLAGCELTLPGHVTPSRRVSGPF